MIGFARGGFIKPTSSSYLEQAEPLWPDLSVGPVSLVSGICQRVAPHDPASATLMP